MVKHARLSASSSKRWLTCPPIIALEELSGEKDRTSSYAEEGTAAHTLSELKLQQYLSEGGAKGAVTRKINKFTEENAWYNQEMEEATTLYRDYVVEILNNHDDLAQIELEQRVKFDKWVPGGFGTSDVVITSPGHIEIIDLKYGKGIKVDAYQNPQLMLYALGAYEKYDFLYDFEKVTMTIVQPRLDHVDSFTVDAEELLYWADNYVAPRAAQADIGIGEWNITEDVTQFSKVRGRLRPQHDQNKAFIEKYEYGEAALLEPHEVADVLAEADQIKKWLKDVENFALQAMLDGQEIDGFKVVEGRSNRKINDETGLANKLRELGFEDADLYRAPQLQTLGKLEKLVGKQEFAEVSADYVSKPTGKPTITTIDDKRPALSSEADAQDDFNDL